MSQFDYQCELPYPAEAVFDLVADVESYPEFLPGWQSARIVERRGNVLVVEQTLVGWGFGWHFQTRAMLDRPVSIQIETDEHPFERLFEFWRFDSLDQSHTRLILHADYVLNDFPQSRLLQSILEEALRETTNAFKRRASEQLD